MARPTMSEEPPATNGITTRIGLDGKACAAAALLASKRQSDVTRRFTGLFSGLSRKAGSLAIGAKNALEFGPDPPKESTMRPLARPAGRVVRFARRTRSPTRQADPHHRALRCGRHLRHPGTPDRAEAHRSVEPAGDRREQAPAPTATSAPTSSRRARPTATRCCSPTSAGWSSARASIRSCRSIRRRTSRRSSWCRTRRTCSRCTPRCRRRTSRS